ncbi:TetR/AcrR family transcriptional regulator [Labedella populi]
MLAAPQTPPMRMFRCCGRWLTPPGCGRRRRLWTASPSWSARLSPNSAECLGTTRLTSRPSRSSSRTIAQHNQRSRDLLLDAIEHLILERPYESISMRDVAERAGISRTAIYNYAPDTLTLLIDAAKRGSGEVDAAIADRAEDDAIPPSRRLRDIVVTLLTEHARSTSAFLAMQSIEQALQQERITVVVIPLRDRIGDRILGVVAAGVASGEFAPVTDPGLTRALMVGVMQAGLRRVGNSRPLSVAEADTVALFLIRALQDPKPGSIAPR